jgi:hypothetical protein
LSCDGVDRRGPSPSIVLAQMRQMAQWKWPRDFPLVQFPNPPLLIALLANGGARLTSGSGHRLLMALSYASLSVWAYEEARHGENWFRRTLGLGFAAYIVIELSRALRS